MRLKITVLYTLWIAIVVAMWIYLGVLTQPIGSDSSYFFWSLGWLIPGGVVSAPFIIYACLGDYDR